MFTDPCFVVKVAVHCGSAFWAMPVERTTSHLEFKRLNTWKRPVSQKKIRTAGDVWHSNRPNFDLFLKFVMTSQIGSRLTWFGIKSPTSVYRAVTDDNRRFFDY